ncbi:MAG: ABC transporter substrate-binding protein [Candidatus Improbicoccus pseudotrichonymphae]|uniref:ABC transporter substrate-binding protein n=1 Tax=Candidatus Improbicoccus pseudotrichonymphae TaxID=3033792 RepID=A0AA48I3Y5_9FIRM|nr:MAG: ABC transporter substrate-binding protein [Candidatus Improbicoccus pseudotrichonymphae]
MFRMSQSRLFFVLTVLMFSVFAVFVFFLSFRRSKINEKMYKIGVMQIVEHKALDQARQGFVDGLKEQGYEDGKNIRFDFQNANGDLSNCETISNKFVKENLDLILAISTPCAQSAAKATKSVVKDIPIVGTAITDYVAAGLAESNEKPNGNVTGTSDLPPIKKQIELILKLNPNVRKIAIFYSTIDISPKFQAEIAKNIIKEKGLTSEVFIVSGLNEVQQVLERAIKVADAFYIPIDKITSAAMPLIYKKTLESRKIVVASEVTLIEFSTATIGMSYYNLGKETAYQAVTILTNKNKPANMPIKYLENNNTILNSKNISELKITVPKEISDTAKIY